MVIPYDLWSRLTKVYLTKVYLTKLFPCQEIKLWKWKT
jgi:hypothetical protein